MMGADPRTALRDLLHGRTAGHDRRLAAFTEPDWRRYADLLAGVFLLAVRRRFVAGQDRAPVIRFVAGVRERYDQTGREVDPIVAEALVWAALGDAEPVPVSAPTVTAQLLLLLGLLHDEGMPPDELDGLLDSAARAAHTPTAQQDQPGQPEQEEEPVPAPVAGPALEPEPGPAPGSTPESAGPGRPAPEQAAAPEAGPAPAVEGR